MVRVRYIQSPKIQRLYVAYTGLHCLRHNLTRSGLSAMNLRLPIPAIDQAARRPDVVIRYSRNRSFNSTYEFPVGHILLVESPLILMARCPGSGQLPFLHPVQCKMAFPSTLDLIHCLVGSLNEIRGSHSFVRQQAHADAGTQWHVLRNPWKR